MSAWENIEVPSPTEGFEEVNLHRNSGDRSKSMDTSVWENIEITSGTCIQIDSVPTSTVESDRKVSATDKGKADLLSALSNRSVNKEMKEFAEKSDSKVMKLDSLKSSSTRSENAIRVDRDKTVAGSHNKRDGKQKVALSASTDKSWRRSHRDNDEDSKRENSEDKQKGKTSDKGKDSPDKEEPEDFLTMVKRKTAEGNLVRAKRLVYGLGHLKGVDNKEIESYLLQQYDIAVNKTSHGWIKDARYYAEVMYSRKWIDENLQTFYQRRRNRDGKDRDERKQERKLKERERAAQEPQQEYQSRFTGMCQDVRLLSNPDLPVVRSNAAAKKSDEPDTENPQTEDDKEDNKIEATVETEEKGTNDSKLENFNQMKNAIEDIIARRSEKQPKINTTEEKQQGIVVKAVTDADQIIQRVQVSLPTPSGGEPCHEVMAGQKNGDDINVSEPSGDVNNSQTDDMHLKDCVVKLDRLPGYYHVKSPKVSDSPNTSISSDRKGNKSPTDSAKSTPKRKLSGSAKKKPWVNSDGELATEETPQDHNYARWIGNDNGCKMTVSSEDLGIDDDCIISCGKPVTQDNVVPVDQSEVKRMQNFVQELFGSANNEKLSSQENEVLVEGIVNHSGNCCDQSQSESFDVSGDNEDLSTKGTSEFQNQFVQFCQQEEVPEGTDLQAGQGFQGEYLQFCQNKE